MIEKELLKKIIINQRDLFVEQYVTRDKLKIIEKKFNTDDVIIITGIRRCGKSVLLSQIRYSQKEKDYYINFDDERLNKFELNDFDVLIDCFEELFGVQKTFYFDEIQNITGWEKFIRRLNDYNNKIFITGSNANLLSRELGTHLTGRYIPIELFPASFYEFLKFKNFQFDKNDLYKKEKISLIKKYFGEFVRDGGFFKFLKNKDKDFFKILFDNIFYRDIVARYKISHEKSLKDIYYFLISNISKEFSYTTLKTISNISSITTIKDYIEYMQNSYLLFEINLYDVSLKRQLINPKKIYSIDTGLSSSISFRFSEDLGRILENIVFLELKRKNYEIFYHRKNKECDFIVRTGIEIEKAIQVTVSLKDEITRKREFEGISEAMEIYDLNEGLILTDDEEGEEIIEGRKISIKPVWKWLLE